MFGFSRKNDDVVALNQKVGRFLNMLTKEDVDAKHKRGESRSRVGVPCVLFLLSEMKSPHSYAVGVTCDISLRGLAMYLQDHLDIGEYILAFGQCDNRTYVAAKCQRCDKAEYGIYRAAFGFTRVLTPKEIVIVSESIRDLERRLSTPAAVPIPVHVMQGASGQFVF